MDKDISKLAQLLRKTGDKVLEGEKTLLLNDTLLKSLNDSFKFLAEEQDCDTSFLVTKTNNSKVTIFHDIQFLHDFIQKVVNVCITEDTGKSACKDNMLDINKFKSLRTLELTRIPVQNVIGIEQIRTQLQCIACIHCLQQLQDLIIKCGADHSNACSWEELSEGIFSYNALETIDNSLLYTPLLQTIDLSHNRLKHFCVEDCLPNLKFLNLNYNLLQSFPTLGKESASKLKTLLLRNNYLKDLSGVAKLKNLAELDVSCNSLVDHSTLVPLENLPLLNKVKLEGNPLSFHHKHRTRTVQHLHLNAARCVFTLDGRSLSRQEQKALRRSGEQRMSLPAGDLFLSMDSALSSSSALYSDTTSPPGDDEDYSTPVVQVQTKRTLRTKRQRQLAKEAVIAESQKCQEEAPNNLLKGDQQHLQVKRDVEQLRQRFGKENWLSEHGATHLQAVLGLPRMSPPTLVDTLSQHSEPQEATSSHCDSRSTVSTEVYSQQLEENQNVPLKVDILCEVNPRRDNKADSSEECEQDEPESQQSEEEDVDERKLFTVRSASPSAELLLLTVGSQTLQERDVKRGRVVQRWTLDALQSCELLSDDQLAVRLTFNVLRRDRRSRVYLVEPSEAKELVQLLGDVLASRSLTEMNQVAYRCMKCSTQFSQEEDARFASKGNTVLCPNCNSSIVCMMEETPLPSRILQGQPALAIPNTIVQALGKSLSSSQSSIGSKDSCSPATVTGSARERSLQVAAVVHQADAPSASPPRPSPSPASAPALTRSAVSLEESCSAISTRRYDSDIEVISNPSQSSIEVLDGESRTPGRKRSSEERQPALVSMEVKAISSPVIPSLGLTESSSSGSFTDSICTTYETQRSTTNGSEEQTSVSQPQNGINNRSAKMNAEPVAEMEEEDEENSFYGIGPVPSIQEMVEGLLEKVDKKLATSAEGKPVTSVVDSSIQYSYSDFQQVDHRLRLFFLQDLLDSQEELLLVVRADILKTGTTNPFPGLVVFSSARVWVLQIIGTEGDYPETWLQENIKLPISCVICVFPLPWTQGVGLRCTEPNSHILMLLQDSQRTHNFLQAAGSLLPAFCGIVKEPANYHHQFTNRMALSCSNFGDPGAQLQLVSMFKTFSIEGENECEVKSGVVVVQTADIFVIESNLSWLFPDSSDNTAMKAVAAQQISDLMEVVTSECHIGLHFVDESRHKEEVWRLFFQTPACVQAVVGAVRTPWEQLFSVPLQVTEGIQR